jgi:hypothetical protein
VKVVALPAGVDPADEPQGFEARLEAAEPYLLYRVRVEIDGADDRESAFRTVKALLDDAPETPERQDAWRYANDKLGMTVQLRAGSGTGHASAPPSRGALDASAKLERNALAGVLAFPELKPVLAEITEDHFYSPIHRAVRAYIVAATPLDSDATSLLAELDATATMEGIDEGTASELLIRLRERELKRQIRSADPRRKKELQETLARLVEHAVRPA